jgi:IS4 transposase
MILKNYVSSYRVKGDFRSRTTSKNFAVRLFYFLFSVAMYNIWILLNLSVGVNIYKEIPKKPVVTAKMFIMEMINGKKLHATKRCLYSPSF